VRSPLIAGLFLAVWALAYFLAGGFVGEFFEGMQRSQLPWWKLAVTFAACALAVFVVILRSSPWLCRCGEPESARSNALDRTMGELVMSRGTTRRGVLHLSAAAAAASTGAGLAILARNHDWLPVIGRIFLTPAKTTAPPQAEWREASIRSLRRLGRTNAMVSDISLGSARIDDVTVARYALDRGINYFDTSPDYAGTDSERILGEAIRGRRDGVFLATKFCAADGHLPIDTPVPKIIEAVEGSLARLQTDYVDLVHIHSCNRLDRLMAPNFHEAFDRLKEQGKARFLGVSSHAPHLEQIVDGAIDSGRFDVCMLAYHFGIWPRFQTLLERAHAHDVGIVAMKTLKGAKHGQLPAFQDASKTYAQAAFRWVLSNPAVSCLVVSMWEQTQIDQYVHASGSALRDSDVALLRRYDQAIAGDYCYPHCGECLDSCTYSLPINDVLRYRMYEKDYGWTGEGKRLYAQLEKTASYCAQCPAPCTNTCPHGVPIRNKMMDAHRLLTA
jgi:hypothetical protein